MNDCEIHSEVPDSSDSFLVASTSSETNQGLRKLVARRDGYRCYLCGVPTGATLEHVSARAEHARVGAARPSRLENLRLACPFCNSTKGDRPVEDFLEKELWRIMPPADLPQDSRAMLLKFFGWELESGYVQTGTPNAKLELKDGIVAVLIRAGVRDRWHRLELGAEANDRVAYAAWDFLRRHSTPPTPKLRKATANERRAEQRTQQRIAANKRQRRAQQAAIAQATPAQTALA